MTVKEYLDLRDRYYGMSESSPEYQETKDKVIQFNKDLVQQYPWLIIRNRWTGEIDEDYDYSFTELDSLPDGWYLDFGLDICKEIQEALSEVDFIGDYRIAEIKEKYGTLRWYDFGAPDKVLREIIPKYEQRSAQICIDCGKPAKWISKGWISYFCDECAKQQFIKRSSWTKEKFEDVFWDFNEVCNEEDR